MIPEGFKIPTNYENISAGATKAYVGISNGQPFRFFQDKVLNAKKSEEAGFEIYDDVDLIEFILDSKCKNVLRCDRHTWVAHPEVLADYRKWKEGKVSNLTDIESWTAISHAELGMLIACGFSTVEQIVEADQEKIDMLGLSGSQLRKKAEQHVNSKKREVNKDSANEEILTLKNELKAKDSEVKELSNMMEEFKKQLAEIANKKAEESELAGKKKAGVQK